MRTLPSAHVAPRGAADRAPNLFTALLGTVDDAVVVLSGANGVVESNDLATVLLGPAETAPLPLARLADRCRAGELVRHAPLDLEGTVLDASATAVGEAVVVVLRMPVAVPPAGIDGLTGLADRFALERELAGILNRGETAAVVLFDLDGFKEVNDSLGHAAGDEVLRVVADRVRAVVRRRDLVARLGGDEFAVLVAGTVDTDALAARILTALDEPMDLELGAVRVGASIGIAAGTAVDASPNELLHCADVAMYAAKRGPDEVCTYGEHLASRSRLRAAIREELGHAVLADELAVRFQPIMDLGADRVRWLEALVRWDHPTRGDVPRSLFLPIAEETGQIVPIGLRVLDEALARITAWRRMSGFEDLRVSVNVSRRQLADPAFVRSVASRLEATGADPSALILELPEALALDRRRSTRDKLVRLRELGVSIAIDRYGGSSGHVQQLLATPVDVLKLDAALVHAAAEGNSLSGSVVRALVAMTRDLGVELVAEGVEMDLQVDFLRWTGCPAAQGFLLQPPMTADEIEALISAPVVAPSV